MHAAIGRRRLAVAAISLGTAVSFGCFRGDNLLAPSGSAGYRPPGPHVAAITLTPTSITGPVGGQVQISASPQGPTGAPVAADAVAWMSSNPSAATVSGSGEVRLKHYGKSTITAIADGVTASVATSVDAPPAATITVTPDSSLIQTGQQVQLLAVAYDSTGAVDSSATLNWSSSNPGVASVSGTGLVTAVAVGAAVITISSGSVSSTAAIRRHVGSHRRLDGDGLAELLVARDRSHGAIDGHAQRRVGQCGERDCDRLVVIECHCRVGLLERRRDRESGRVGNDHCDRRWEERERDRQRIGSGGRISVGQSELGYDRRWANGAVHGDAVGRERQSRSAQASHGARRMRASPRCHQAAWLRATQRDPSPLPRLQVESAEAPR